MSLSSLSPRRVVPSSRPAGETIETSPDVLSVSTPAELQSACYLTVRGSVIEGVTNFTYNIVKEHASRLACTPRRSSQVVSRLWPASSRVRGGARRSYFRQLVVRSPVSLRTGLFHSDLCLVRVATRSSEMCHAAAIAGFFPT